MWKARIRYLIGLLIGFAVVACLSLGVLWLTSCGSTSCFGPVPASLTEGHNKFTAALPHP